jgi:hypothetical protein
MLPPLTTSRRFDPIVCYVAAIDCLLHPLRAQYVLPVDRRSKLSKLEIVNAKSGGLLFDRAAIDFDDSYIRDCLDPSRSVSQSLNMTARGLIDFTRLGDRHPPDQKP